MECSVIYTPTTACRGCGFSNLFEVYSLGNLHINAFPKPDEPDTPKAPLTLVQCGDCDLVQLSASVQKDLLYREYHYRSGVNPKLANALHEVVEQAQRFVTLQAGDAVLDIGCNDGTLLDAYPDFVHQYGVDPSDIAIEAVRPKSNRAVIHTYWPAKFVNPVPCRIITTIAMLYDVDDLDSFAEGVKKWLHPDGVWVIEVADLRAMIENNAIDAICHEHVSYFSAGTLTRWLWRHGFKVVSLVNTPVNGGSLRAFCQLGSAGYEPHPYRLFPDEWKLLRQRVDGIWSETQRYFDRMAKGVQRVGGLAASTKGNTLLQHFDLGPGHLFAIADRQPHKVGRVTVGTRIPIISEEAMRAQKPDGLYVLAWHLMDVLQQREKAYLATGGHFAASLPRFATIGTLPISL